MTAPLQSTVNKWCNTESILEYVKRLRKLAQNEANDGKWNDDPAATARANALDNAADAMESAARAADKAAMASTQAAYDRIYAPRVQA